MSFPGRHYAPPGVYTQTDYDNPIIGALESLKIPVFIGEGNEHLHQVDLEVVRGSSSVVDQQVVGEDATGRAVMGVSNTGIVTRGDFDGEVNRLQVRHLPLVDGSGRGKITNSRNDVSVTINGKIIVVTGVDGAAGIVTLAQAPKAGDLVRISYYYNREDTLITDNLSSQVPNTKAEILGVRGVDPGSSITFTDSTKDSQGNVLIPGNNEFSFIVDGETFFITIPAGLYNVTQVADMITAQGLGALEASRFTNNHGKDALRLTSEHSLVIKSGTANQIFGLHPGDSSLRRRTFYTQNGPIVDGTNGGVTTTDPSHVTVKVDGVQVIPESVDGASRAVTLPVAPKAGAEVLITYWFNTWQDTYDHLAHINITDINRVGDVPGGRQYTQGADYILQDDKIFWGTAVAVKPGLTSVGSDFFGSNQISTTLIDDRAFLEPCLPVSGINGVSDTQFVLPQQPTLGNGRDTALGQSVFQTIANSRIGVPVNRTDVIQAYWGYSVDDAINRGEVEILKVEGNAITLKNPVPADAKVFASFYYNRIANATYFIESVLPGVSGVGTYTIKDEQGNTVFVPQYEVTSNPDVEFPRGSILTPGIHFERHGNQTYLGPTQEIVTVEFASTADSPAIHTLRGSGPFEFIKGQSDQIEFEIGGTPVQWNMDQSIPTANGTLAHLVGDQIEPGMVLSENRNFIITLDSTVVNATVDTGADIDEIVDSINMHADGIIGTAVTDGGALDTVEIDPLAIPNSGIEDAFVGWALALEPAGQPVEYKKVVAYDATNSIIQVDSNWVNPVNPADAFRLFNPNTQGSLKGATQFNGPIDLTNGFNKLDLEFALEVNGLQTLSVDWSAAPPPVFPLANAAAMATELNLSLRGASGDDITIPADAGSPIGLLGLPGFDVLFTADGAGRLQIRFQLPVDETAGFLKFKDQANPNEDLALLAGFDFDTCLNMGQVAKVVEDPATPGTNQHLVLRNRILPGTLNADAQCKLVVGPGSLNDLVGFETNTIGRAAMMTVVITALVSGRVKFSNGQDAATGEPLVVFHDGTGSHPANNVLDLVVDDNPYQVVFAASSAGVPTQLGVVDYVGSVLEQIDNVIGPTGADVAEIFLEGTNIVIRTKNDSVSGNISVGAESANTPLGLQTNAMGVRYKTDTEIIVSALNAHRDSPNLETYLHDFSDGTNGFGNLAIAQTVYASGGKRFIHIETLATGAINASILIAGGTWLLPGTGLGEFAGTQVVGADGIDGFFVISTDGVKGSGSVNTSKLNPLGLGQDGIVGQTYHDDVTGLTFTVLPKGYHDNPLGPWTPYTSGDTFVINVRHTITTDANIPVDAIPGIEMVVANTVNVATGDTADLTTYPRGGREPAIGDLYYTSYTYQKQDFTTAFYTKMQSIVEAYGPIHPDNPVTLASYLAMMNGAVLVGIKQVPRAEGSSYADIQEYVSAVGELEGALPGHIKPDMITPLRGDSEQLFQLLSHSNDMQSSIRYRSERTSIIGLSAGSDEQRAKHIATNLNSDRMRLVYPEIALMDIEEEDGIVKEHLIDGPMLAAMLTGSVVSPNYDVASPWTRRRLVGPSQLGRFLDAVQQNQLAVNGVTVLEDRPPFIQVRHGLTTDMSNVLTKTPTVRLISDHVQKQSRQTLDRFIGKKFLPGILSQIEGNMAKMLQTLVRKNIIAIYTGIRASVDPEDPTAANVEAYYQPVFPLLYIVLQFHLRSNL